MDRFKVEQTAFEFRRFVRVSKTGKTEHSQRDNADDTLTSRFQRHTYRWSPTKVHREMDRERRRRVSADLPEYIRPVNVAVARNVRVSPGRNNGNASETRIHRIIDKTISSPHSCFINK